MAARWPGSIPAGEVREAPVYFADSCPRSLTWAGSHSRQSPALDGVSFVPTLLGEDQGASTIGFYTERLPTRLPRAIWPRPRYGEMRVFRTDRGGDTELDDLSQDEPEENDLSDEHPGIICKCECFFADAHEESPQRPTW